MRRRMVVLLFKEVVISGEKETLVDVFFCMVSNSSSAIIYSCFAGTNIFAPAVVSTLGPTVSMFIGGTTYL